MSRENINPITPSKETLKSNSEHADLDDIAVFNLETFQKQLSRLDSKKQKTPIKLANNPDVADSSGEKEIVGDDLKNQVPNIVCECQPNVTGGAVPAISSFSENLAVNSSDITPNNKTLETTKTRHKQLQTGIEKPKRPHWNRSQKITNQNTLPSCTKSIINNTKGVNVDNSNKFQPQRGSRSSKRDTVQSQDQAKRPLLNAVKMDCAIDKLMKKTTMIPKLVRPNTTGKISHEKLWSLDTSYYGSDKSSTDRIKPKLSTTKSNSSSLACGSNNISIKKFDLKERLKLTTTMLRKKINNNSKNDEKTIHDNYSPSNMSSAQENSSIRNKNFLTKLRNDISQVEQDILNIPVESNLQLNNYQSQLLSIVDRIKEVAKEINIEHNEISDNVMDKTESRVFSNNISKPIKTKDNKIHIKFMQSKETNEKKLKKNVSKHIEKKTLNPIKLQDFITTEKVSSENIVRGADSMDGVFIPTCEPPRNIEEEEEESNGLDITITLPELNSTISNHDGSVVSVKLSDISEEAIRKLKRCPKDFILRMDFVQGKVIFQSRNNFTVGPDLNFVEHPITDGKSDVINIKPSTECRFTSQLISVEDIKDLSSTKSLKSTDSELFNVVKMPFIYNNPSMSTVTRSCVTFHNNRNIFSLAIIARHLFKSMPQIASLSNLFDDRFVALNRSVLNNAERKRKNRLYPKRTIESSTII